MTLTDSHIGDFKRFPQSQNLGALLCEACVCDPGYGMINNLGIVLCIIYSEIPYYLRSLNLMALHLVLLVLVVTQ